MATSELTRVNGGWCWAVKLRPVPKSSPRVPRFGKPYYVGKYLAFREEIAEHIASIELPEPFDGPVWVELELVVPRPAKPANPFPMGDLDNYEKATYDAIQKRAFFADDKQITRHTVGKRYAEKGEDAHIHIHVYTCEPAPFTFTSTGV